MRLFIKAFVGMLILIAFLGFFTNVFGILNEKAKQSTIDQHRAIVFSDVYAHRGDFKPGEPFHAGDAVFIHYKIVRLRTCTVVLQFRLTLVKPGDRFTGGASFSYPRTAYYGPPASLETNEYFKIPREMPPGHYEMRRINFIDCDNTKWVEFAPPAPLDIIQ